MASDFGIKVSLDGKDVLSLDPGSLDLVFDTNSNSLKLKSDATSSGYGQYDTDRTLTFYASTVGGFEPYIVYDSNSYYGKRRIKTPVSVLLT